MLKEYEQTLIERYKHYYSYYLRYEKPHYCNGDAIGHAHEISWILHTLFGYTDRQILDIEKEVDVCF